MDFEAELKPILAAAHADRRVEVVSTPNIAPSRGVPSVSFTTADEFKAGVEALGETKVGNAETVTVYVRPRGAGWVADFAI